MMKNVNRSYGVEDDEHKNGGNRGKSVFYFPEALWRTLKQGGIRAKRKNFLRILPPKFMVADGIQTRTEIKKLRCFCLQPLNARQCLIDSKQSIRRYFLSTYVRTTFMSRKRACGDFSRWWCLANS